MRESGEGNKKGGEKEMQGEERNVKTWRKKNKE